MHLLILNRWSDEFAAYDEFINHDEHRVTYIVNEDGKVGIESFCRAQNRRVYEVEALDDLPVLYDLFQRIERERGAVDRVFSMSEYDLAAGAALRTRFKVPGYDSDRIRGFKDKVTMKTKVGAAGLRVPRYCDTPSADAMLAFGKEVGYPVVVKPRQGAASHGVSIQKSPEGLAEALRSVPLGEHECEEYIAGSIYHVDGLQFRGKNEFRRVSKYINTCLGYALGEPLGSFMVDDAQLLRAMNEFSDRVLAALGLTDGPYHLEVIMKDEREPVFLEIGARVGGGEIPFLLQELYGANLIGELIKTEMGHFRPGSLLEGREPVIGGFLLVPPPQEKLCRVTSRNSLMGQLPTLYKELLPEVGSTLSWEDNTGYEKIGGRFRYRGASSAAIERDILETIRTYRVSHQPVAS